MVEKVKILDVSLLMFSSILSIFLGIGSFVLFSLSGTDVIFVALIGIGVSYPLLRVVKYIINNNKYEDIFELNKTNSPIIGKFLNIILFIGLYILALFIFFNISDFINIEYFTETGLNFTKVLVLLPILYILTKDLNSILKVNQIFSIVSTILILTDVIGILGSFEITNLEPLLTTPRIDFLKSILYYVCFYGVSLAMIALIGKGKILENDLKMRKNNIGNTINKVYIFVSIVQFIIILGCILTLGIEYIHIFRFPEYVSLKQFSLFNILERIENILSLQFYFNSVSILSYIIYNLVKLLPKSSKVKIYPFVILLTMYILTGVIFKNNSYFINYVQKYFVPICYLLIIFPILITYIVLHKKQHENA